MVLANFRKAANALSSHAGILEAKILAFEAGRKKMESLL